MNRIFFTPGPSQLYPTLRKHIETAFTNDIASISHRSKRFEEIFSETVANLRKLLSIPQTHQVFFLASGTEAMERVIENLVEKQSFHFVNGSFSKRFFLTAQELQKEPKLHEVPLGEGFDLQSVKIPKKAELICFTHNETSTGVMIPIAEIHAMQKRFPDKLLALDIVSSVPYPKLDFGKLDCVFFSVQKLFGLPAGLCVVIVSPEAFEKSLMLQKKGVNIGSYHSFPSLAKYASKNQTPETPPVFLIYLLNRVVQDMLSGGVANMRKDIEERAEMIYTFFDHHKKWKPFVKEKKFRSPTVITVQTDDDTSNVKKYLEVHGAIVGSGYGTLKETQIRIANFPAVSLKDVVQLLGHLRNF